MGEEKNKTFGKSTPCFILHLDDKRGMLLRPRLGFSVGKLKGQCRVPLFVYFQCPEGAQFHQPADPRQRDRVLGADQILLLLIGFVVASVILGCECNPLLLPISVPLDSNSPLYLPYKTLVSTVGSMVFNEGEAQQLIEILSEKTGIIQDTWHKVGPLRGHCSGLGAGGLSPLSLSGTTEL